MSKEDIMTWAIDENEFLIQLVSLHQLRTDSLEKGTILIQTYLKANQGCVCHEVLTIVCEVFTQLSTRANQLARDGKIEESDEALQALLEFETSISSTL